MTASFTVPSEVVDDHADHLLDPEAATVARTMASALDLAAWTGGKSPSGVAAGCLYVAQFVTGPTDLTQREVADDLDVTKATIRKHYREIPGVAAEVLDPDDCECYDAITWLADGVANVEASEAGEDNETIEETESKRLVDRILATLRGGADV